VANKRVKLILKLVLLVTAVGLMIFAFIPERVKVDMITVERGDILITMEGEGKTRIHDIYVVSTPIDGRVTRIESEPGDLVTAGETVIANMYPANPSFLDKRSETQARADVEGAKAALSLANARVRQAEVQLEYEVADFKRTEQLYKKHTVSKAKLEQDELRIKTLRADLDTALSNKRLMQSRLEAAEVRLLQPEEGSLANRKANLNCQICIHSPVDGRVLRILHKSESIVPVGTALVEIGDPADLEVKIEMLSTNVVRVEVGDAALIKRWGGGDNIRARVRVIEPSGYTKISALGVEEQRVNVILGFVDPIDKWQTLGDAFRVEAAIIIDRADDVLKIPLSALFRHNEVWSVFRVEDGVANIVAVKVSRRNDRFVEIDAGINVGDHIIVHPSNRVEDGRRVERR